MVSGVEVSSVEVSSVEVSSVEVSDAVVSVVVSDAAESVVAASEDAVVPGAVSVPAGAPQETMRTAIKSTNSKRVAFFHERLPFLYSFVYYIPKEEKMQERFFQKQGARHLTKREDCAKI